MIRHFNIRVRGVVQGVFFRATARDTAMSLGITGFVQNEPDGSVYIEAEGEGERIEKFLAWCKVGPPRAAVNNVEIADGEIRGFKRFEITRG